MQTYENKNTSCISLPQIYGSKNTYIMIKGMQMMQILQMSTDILH
jgi:hypothetical protein